MNIYLSNETNFDKNGVGFLNDVISAKVTEILNGDYILDLEYPVNGLLSEYLVEDNIIKTNVGNDNFQLFRIKQVTKDFSFINVYAIHITYDLLDNMLLNVAPEKQNCASFGQWLLDNTAIKNKFTFESDITGIASARYVRKNPIEAILGNENNSMINLFDGELERDNFKFKMLSSRGSNNGVKLMFGKNITDIKITIDITSLYTRLIPLGFDGLMLPEIYVDSLLISNYYTPKISKVEFSDIKYDPEDENAFHNVEEAYQELRNRCKELFNQGLDKPIINIKIDWLELSKVEEYKKMYYNLEKVRLGDTITANILGLDYTTKVTKTIYNVLTDSIDKFEIGTLQKTISNTINNTQKEVESINVTSILKSATENASNLITSAMGGFVYKTQTELYIMDTDDINTAQKVWRWNINGLGYSSTGINGQYEIAMTMDGAINANMITTGKLNTNYIEGYEDLILQIKDFEKDVNASLELKIDRVEGKDDKDSIVSLLNASADEINLKANRFSLESTNATITKEGIVDFVSGEIGGIEIGEDYLRIPITTEYDFTQEDVDKVRNSLIGLATLTDEEKIKFDVSGDGKVMSNDALIMQRIVDAGITVDKTGYFEIKRNKEKPYNSGVYIVGGNGSAIASMTLEGVYTKSLAVSEKAVFYGSLTVGGVDIANKYTTEEQVVGKWIDGKPIYRKVIPFISVASYIATGITGLENIVKMECTIHQSSGGWRNLPWLYASNNAIGGGNWAGGFYYREDTNCVHFQVGTDLGAIDKGFVTLEYTKTTD